MQVSPLKSFSALLRRILLVASLLISLILLVTRMDIHSDSGKILLYAFAGAVTLYLLVSVITIIIMRIRRSHMEETDAQKDIFLTVIPNHKNNLIILHGRHLAFWGTIMLVVNLLVFKVTRSDLIGGPFSANVYLRGYHGYLLWSLIAFVALFIISVLYFKFFLPHEGENVYGTGTYIGKLLVSDLTAPFSTIKTALSKNDKGKRVGILSLIIMVIFIIVNGIAVVINLI